MKAVDHTEYGHASNLRIKEIDKPIPGPSDVLVKIQAAAINDWDWSLVSGKPFYIRLLCGLRKPKVNIPGLDISGEVEAVGSEVTRFKVGDRIYGDLSESGFGGFAEFVCVPEKAIAIKPGNIDFVEAAAIPHAAELALQGLRDEGNLQAHQSLLINGAGGGVGTIGIQIARELGVKQVAGVDHTEKMELMNSLGFDSVIDYTKEDFTDGKNRYDLILDTKTNRSIFRYLKALHPHGTYVTVGGSTFRLIQALLLAPLVALFSKKRIRIVALKTNRNLDYIRTLVESGKITPTIDSRHPLDAVSKAIERFGSGKHQGKVILLTENSMQSTGTL